MSLTHPKDHPMTLTHSPPSTPQENSLQCLRLAANALTGESAGAIADLVSNNPMIRELDVSANDLGAQAGRTILAALQNPQWLYPEHMVSGGGAYTEHMGVVGLLKGPHAATL